MAADVEAVDIAQPIAEMRINRAVHHPQAGIEDIYHCGRNRRSSLKPVAEVEAIKPRAESLDSLLDLGCCHCFLQSHASGQ